MRFRLLLLLSSFVLLSCGRAQTHTVYGPPDGEAMRLCTASCEKSRIYAELECSQEERICLSEIKAQAMKDFDRYASMQSVLRETVELRPVDFERPEKCLKAECRALSLAGYNSCYAGCGAKVAVRSSCLFLCF